MQGILYNILCIKSRLYYFIACWNGKGLNIPPGMSNTAEWKFISFPAADKQPKSIIHEIIKKIRIDIFQYPGGKWFSDNMRGRVWGYIRPFFNTRPRKINAIIWQYFNLRFHVILQKKARHGAGQFTIVEKRYWIYSTVKECCLNRWVSNTRFSS